MHPTTRKRLDEIAAREAKATEGEWLWTLTKQTTRAEVLAHFTEIYDGGEEGPLHGCGVPAPGGTIEEGCLTTAITGNGPTSEANAKFICAAHNTDLPYLLRLAELQAAVIGAERTADEATVAASDQSRRIAPEEVDGLMRRFIGSLNARDRARKALDDFCEED